jgi:hypothetical protein
MAGLNYPLLLAAGVALLLSGLVGAAAVTGVLPVRSDPNEAAPALEKTATAAAARRANCRSCGVVAAVRKVRAEGDAYRVTVRMDDGRERTVTSSSAPPYAVGARVKVNGNALERG